MRCNGRGFNNGGGGVIAGGLLWPGDLEFHLLSVQALFLMPRILEIAFPRLYIYICSFFGGGGGGGVMNHSQKEPYILFLNLFCHTIGSRVLKMLLKPQSNKLICNQKKLVDKKIVFIINIIIVFHFRHRKPQGLFYSSAIPA